MKAMNRLTLYLASAIVAMLAISCNKEIDNRQEEPVITNVSICASYAQDVDTRTIYSESGSVISATWQTGDQLLVVFDGKVNTFTLTDGLGTDSATFTGSIVGTPSASSVLTCYVRDANNAAALTASGTGALVYSDAAFLAQDGTLEGAARCNTHSGTTTFGDGSNLSVELSVNTSMLKFTVFAPNGVTGGTEGATLTYKSGATVLAKATFTVGTNGQNTIYLAVPAGKYSGEQTLVYKSGESEGSKMLSATHANFSAGQTYSKELNYVTETDISTLSGSSYTAKNGAILTGTYEGSTRLKIDEDAIVIFRNMTLTSTRGVECEGNATIILEGDNTVTATNAGRPGITIDGSRTFTIRGQGSLTVTGASAAPGIGGGLNSHGNIIIEDGIITATGGQNAAGIGGGYSTDCGDITILGGTVIATGGSSAAGIGGGGGNASRTHGLCGNITISGGTVTAKHGSGASYDVGSGVNSYSGLINITVPVSNGSGGSASTSLIDLSGITGDYTAPHGVILTGTYNGSSRVTIESDAIIRLNNATISTGILCAGEATVFLHGTNTVSSSTSYRAGITVGNSAALTIKGSGSLSVTGGYNAAGIGGGNDDDSSGNVIIEGGIITATGGQYGAGIGGGERYTFGDITITGGTVTAIGGDGSAGIGGGNGGYELFHGAHGTYGYCGNITISGGSVTATHGSGVTYDVGPGSQSYCGTVSVSVSVSNGNGGSASIYNQ